MCFFSPNTNALIPLRSHATSDVRNCFNGIEIPGDGLHARIKAGTIISAANRALLPYSRILGPGPASSGVATIRGVVANNASGMTSGRKFNSYHTVASMKVRLSSGTVIDTLQIRRSI